jgi:hypothetical protein
LVLRQISLRESKILPSSALILNEESYQNRNPQSSIQPLLESGSRSSLIRKIPNRNLPIDETDNIQNIEVKSNIHLTSSPRSQELDTGYHIVPIPEPQEGTHANEIEERNCEGRRQSSSEEFGELHIVERRNTQGQKQRPGTDDIHIREFESSPGNVAFTRIKSDHSILEEENRLSHKKEAFAHEDQRRSQLYPSLVFVEEQKRIQKINQIPDRSKEGSHHLNNYFLPKVIVTPSNLHQKSKLAFELAKRSSIQTVGTHSKIASPISSPQQYSIINDTLSGSKLDFHEHSKLDLSTYQQFSKKQNILRYENMSILSKIPDFKSKCLSGSREEKLPILRGTGSPRYSIKVPFTNSYITKSSQPKRHKELGPHSLKKNRISSASRLLHLIFESRMVLSLQKLHDRMLANLSGEIPQHAKPIQLMRVAHLLKFFFKSKAKQAIKKIGIFATRKLTKSTSQEEIKIETIKFELDNETSSILESRKIDKPKAINLI